MKRVDLGAGTLTRVRWQQSPLMELTSLVRLGLRGERHPLLGRSRDQVLRALARPETALVRCLVPPRGHGPFPFVTVSPVQGSTTLADELDRVAGGSRAWLDSELSQAGRQLPRHVVDLVEEGRLGPALADSLHVLWGLLMPDDLWAEVTRAGREEIAVRCGQVGTEGLDHALATLHPAISWAGPGRMVLHKPVDSERTLVDEPLVLIPTVLGGSEPLVALEDEIPAIAYAARRPSRADRADRAVRAVRADRADHRSTLLGATRARVLHTLETGECSTTELARLLDLPVTTVSSHLAVLHRAGVVARRRAGRSVLYAALPDPATIAEVSAPGATPPPR